MNTITPKNLHRFNRPEIREEEVLHTPIPFAAPSGPSTRLSGRRYPSLSDDGQPWFASTRPAGPSSSVNLVHVRVISLLAVVAILIALALAN